MSNSKSSDSDSKFTSQSSSDTLSTKCASKADDGSKMNSGASMNQATGKTIQPIILVHGGAGDIPSSRVAKRIDGVRVAARLGYKTFSETGSVLEATIKAVKILENDPSFNAGKGSVLTSEGTIEMEALVMEGRTLKAGAVTCLKNVPNPIEVARLVMEKTPHVILCGKAAKSFASDHGVPHAEDSYLFTKDARRSIDDFHYQGGLPEKSEVDLEAPIGETVGAVGIDANGNVVSCTSTGGMIGKMPGRVGDTPIPGAGGYADNDLGAVSTTGNGEAILMYNLSQRILMSMQSGKSAQEAIDDCLAGLKKATKKTAGAIVISKTGEFGVGFSSKNMPWACVQGNKLIFGVEPDDRCEENI